jgi:hypothetical protein
MEKEYKPFDPKSLGSEKILLLKLKDVEIEKDQNINDTNIEFEDYIVDFIFFYLNFQLLFLFFVLFLFHLSVYLKNLSL